jgi:hypothetical protein
MVITGVHSIQRRKRNTSHIGKCVVYGADWLPALYGQWYVYRLRSIRFIYKINNTLAAANPLIAHPAVIPMSVVSEVPTSSRQDFHLRIHRRMLLFTGYCCSHERYECELLAVTTPPI